MTVVLFQTSHIQTEGIVHWISLVNELKERGNFKNIWQEITSYVGDTFGSDHF